MNVTILNQNNSTALTRHLHVLVAIPLLSYKSRRLGLIYRVVRYSICLLAVWPVSVSYRHLPVGIFGLVFFVL
jgi:hypothetical protein